MGVFTSVKQSSVVHLMFAITFFTSGLIINFFQCILYFGLRPFSRYLYRKINYYLCYSFYCQLVFMAEWWAGSDLILYIDKEDFDKYFGNEHGYLLMNHSYETDWLIGWMLCDRVRLLGNCKAYAKKSIQYIPTLGWAWKFAESIFLERSWEKDKEKIKYQIKELVDYPDTMWLLLYPEGTRFTSKKLEASQKFAIEKGLPVLKYHLTPRTKGFTASVPHMRGKATAIYDIQIAFKPSDPVKPTMKNLLLGKRLEGHMYAKRIPIEEVPEDDEAAAEWLHKLYQQKSLRCRSGIQQADDQFRKIVQMCKKRSTGDNSYSDDSSSSEDSSEESSNIDIFDTKFFLSGGNKYSNSQSWKDQNNQNNNNNRNRGNDKRSGNDRRYSFNYSEENTQYPNRGNNNRYFNGAARSSYEQLHNSNSENYKERKQACVIQCFFNELNMVDQRGFPEQDSIIQLVTHNVRNPELQDFLEEAVIECFHYLSSSMRQDNCYFSQNLLSCLTDKGKERCEDWNN